MYKYGWGSELINIYEGDFLDDLKNGFGKEYNSYNKLIFEGEYKNGCKFGEWKTYDPEGNLISVDKYGLSDQ